MCGKRREDIVNKRLLKERFEKYDSVFKDPVARSTSLSIFLIHTIVKPATLCHLTPITSHLGLRLLRKQKPPLLSQERFLKNF